MIYRKVVKRADPKIQLHRKKRKNIVVLFLVYLCKMIDVN